MPHEQDPLLFVCACPPGHDADDRMTPMSAASFFLFGTNERSVYQRSKINEESMGGVCWHRRWGMACDASDDTVRNTVRDIFAVLRRNVTQNESQIRQLGLDYQRFLEKKHPECSDGEEKCEEVPDLPAPPPPPPVATEAPPAVAPPPRKRRKGKTATSAAPLVTPSETVQNETDTTSVTVPAVVVSTDTVESFRDVDFTEGVPDFVIQTSRSASFYSFLHTSNPESYPLSTIEFKNRRELHQHGLEKIYSNDAAAWGFDKIKALWFARDSTTNQRYVCALIINEEYEPRFGNYFCSRKDIVEMDVRPIPCFLKGRGYGSIRYCGTWTFQLQRETSQPFVYVTNGCQRGAVYKMTLDSYDDRWGVRA